LRGGIDAIFSPYPLTPKIPLLYHSTLGLRLIKKKTFVSLNFRLESNKEEEEEGFTRSAVTILARTDSR